MVPNVTVLSQSFHAHFVRGRHLAQDIWAWVTLTVFLNSYNHRLSPLHANIRWRNASFHGDQYAHSLIHILRKSGLLSHWPLLSSGGGQPFTPLCTYCAYLAEFDTAPVPGPHSIPIPTLSLLLIRKRHCAPPHRDAPFFLFLIIKGLQFLTELKSYKPIL